MTWFKWAGAALVAVAIFASGYKYAAAIYEADIADLQAQHALTTKELTDEYRRKEQDQAKQLADAWDKYEKARAESVDLRADVDRVRDEADRYRAELSRAGADSCKHFAKRLSNCVGLLYEGSGLAAEGAELSQKLSGKHDAVVKIHEAQ